MKYAVTLTLLRDQLGTNPCDPNVMDTHIINKQRKLILDKNKVNSEINKYLEAIAISSDRGEAEVNALFDKLENLTGLSLTPEERALAVAGKLDSLKETFASLQIQGTTVFFWNQEKNLPMIGDHMIYGFMKAACEAIGRCKKDGETKKKGTPLESISYTQALINQHVRCREQFITFDKDVKRKDDGEIFFLQRSLRAMTAQGPRITLAKSEVVPAGAKLSFTLSVMEDSPLTEKILRKIFDYGEQTGLGQWRNAGHGMFEYELEELT